jgi:hypothetical protein
VKIKVNLGQRIIYFLNSLHQIIYFQQNTEQKNNLKEISDIRIKRLNPKPGFILVNLFPNVHLEKSPDFISHLILIVIAVKNVGENMYCRTDYHFFCTEISSFDLVCFKVINNPVSDLASLSGYH